MMMCSKGIILNMIIRGILAEKVKLSQDLKEMREGA